MQKDLPSKVIIEETASKARKEITDQKVVSDVFHVLRDAKWEKGMPNMPRGADYNLYFEIEGVDAKPVLFELWVHPDESQFFVVKRVGNVQSSLKESVVVRRAIKE